MKTASDHYNLVPALRELALDLHWSWSHATDKIWRRLDPTLWELTHNPFVVLQTVSKLRIETALNDPLVMQLVKELVENKRQTAIAPAWFQKNHPHFPLHQIAYFSMEFMLSEALPIYSGGLGNVAGDLLKTASDLGLPLIGVGLLFQQGYPRQVVYKDGSQQYVAPYNDPGQLPLQPLHNGKDELLRIEIRMPGFSVWLRTWKVQVGRNLLLLLDSNDAANFPMHRGLTSELYGGDAEMRLMQEILLGIGGWRLLKALNIQTNILHLNEGHTAFAALERVASFMEENNVNFETALHITRAGNIFTTHTAVGAGFDRFLPSMVENYLAHYVKEKLRLQMDDFLALGRINAHNRKEPFNTGYLAISLSGKINGVSRLHAAVSRSLFAPLFPRWPLSEVPVNHVTNGVHMPTWDSPEADRLWTEACGKDRWLGTVEAHEQNINNISNEKLWQLRRDEKNSLIQFIRKRYARQLAMTGDLLRAKEVIHHLFNSEVLTICFARRFAGYKRPTLLLKNAERLKRILLNKEKPVQLIVAGKAHAADAEGRSMIKAWINFMNDKLLQEHAIFLSDYDMSLTAQLVQGVDLWMNTPRRPWEACGTSGMKVLVNGGLHLSSPDGWWDEAYQSSAGWVFGNKETYRSAEEQDAAEAEMLYDLLEHEIIPAFYNRDENGLPLAWIEKMRKSMAVLTPAYSSNRTLIDYTENFYLPAAEKFNQRSARPETAAQVVNQHLELKKNFKNITIHSFDHQELNGQLQFRIKANLNGISPELVQMQLYAEAKGTEPVFIQTMEADGRDEEGSICFKTSVALNRNVNDFTPRLIAQSNDLSLPLECNAILWQR